MRVALISHSAGRRGAELALRDAARSLAERSVEVVVLVPGRGPLEDELNRLGLATASYTMVTWVSGQAQDRYRTLAKAVLTPLAVARLVSVLRREKVDAVISNTIWSPVGALAAYVLGLPHIWYIHEFLQMDHHCDFDFSDSVVAKVLEACGGVFLCNSGAVEKRWRSFLSRFSVDAETRVIYQYITPFDLGEKAARALCVSQTVNLLFVGSLTTGKGPVDLVRAAAVLAGEGRDVRVAFVGAGPLQAEIQHLARELGIGDATRFPGEVEDPAPWYAWADIVVIPSRMEAFGRVAVEGMLAGRPVVCGARGGLREIIRDGETGFLYPPGDYRALADRLHLLAANPDLARRIANRAKLDAHRRFSPERFGDELLRLVEGVVSRKEGSVRSHGT